jgi:hypothetical protein
VIHMIQELFGQTLTKDTQARPANSNSAWILQGKKGRADAASKRCLAIKSHAETRNGLVGIFSSLSIKGIYGILSYLNV